jgi:uncharacterized repeat protein (TIGR03803 family)
MTRNESLDEIAEVAGSHMRTLAHLALSIGAATGLLVGCGAFPPSLPKGQDDVQPIGAPRAIPKSNAAAPSSYRVVYRFGGSPDGKAPEASLINVSNALYGTTYAGGKFFAGDGTVFRVTTSGTEKVLHSFGNGTDGAFPFASLINVGRTLYGTTEAGGTHWNGSSEYFCGTVFSINEAGREHVLYSFACSPDGEDPKAGLINVGGTLYGTTKLGGAHGLGTVFSISTSGKEKVLYSFAGSPDGALPSNGSLIDVNGTLYGSTSTGGRYDRDHDAGGTVFRVSTSGTEKVLHSFGKGADGVGPTGALIDVNGTLYGATYMGGTDNSGTVFSISTSGKEKVLHTFDGPDGYTPYAGLIDVKGRLYGTTAAGGTHSEGNVFSMSTSGTEKELHSFGGGSDGAYPEASLIEVNGTLYGTTFGGGQPKSQHPNGTVFALSP